MRKESPQQLDFRNHRIPHNLLQANNHNKSLTLPSMMSSPYTQCHQQVRPQSIVHHIGRLGSRIARPISIRRKMRKQRKKLQGGSIGSFSQQPITVSESDSTSVVESLGLSITSSVAFSRASGPVSNDDISSLGDYHSIDSDDAFTLLSDVDEDSQGEEEEEEEEGLFETFNQNEFLIECFLTNEHSDALFLVHFFNHETSISNDVEHILSMRVLESKCKCECRRIDSKGAPLFTGKLQIDPEQPSTVVAIKNGKVLSKVSGISSSTCTEVDQWLKRTGLLHASNTSINTFLSTSTHSER